MKIRTLFTYAVLGLMASTLSARSPHAQAQSDVLYDTLYIYDDNLHDGGVGNAIGGSTIFPEFGTIDSQVADDFEIDADYEITRVVRDFMCYNGNVPVEGIWVQFYPDEGGQPAEDAFAEHVVPFEDFDSIDLGEIIGFQGWRFDMDLAGSGIVLPQGKWWLDVQPLDINTKGDWFWSIRSILTLIESPIHVRDGWQEHGNNYYGLWGSPDWIELDFRGNGSLSMRIEGERGVAGCLELSLDRLVGGEVTTFIVARGTPGVRAVLVGGLQTGETVVNGNFGFCATFGIKGVNPRRVIGGFENSFDANGEITIQQFVPSGAQGVTVHLQASMRGTCPDECMSNLLTEVVQ